MSFCWVEDPRAEAEGIVLAVDVTRHARQVGFENTTLVSRGLWVRFVGAGPGQEERLLRTLLAAGRCMSNPSRASEDGSAALFELQASGTGPAAEVISVTHAERNSLVLMLRREFDHPFTGRRLRVRVVAEDDIRARA
jgi:hypothetical protein